MNSNSSPFLPKKFSPQRFGAGGYHPHGLSFYSVKSLYAPKRFFRKNNFTEKKFLPQKFGAGG
jgi:hypothetical protein